MTAKQTDITERPSFAAMKEAALSVVGPQKRKIEFENSDDDENVNEENTLFRQVSLGDESRLDTELNPDENIQA